MRAYLQNGIHLAEVLKRVESERSAKIDNAKLGKRVTYLEFEIDKLKECNACSGDLSAKKDRVREGMDMMANIVPPFTALSGYFPEGRIAEAVGLAAYFAFKALSYAKLKKIDGCYAKTGKAYEARYAVEKRKTEITYSKEKKRIDEQAGFERERYTTECVKELEIDWRRCIAVKGRHSSLEVSGSQNPGSPSSFVYYKTTIKYADVTIVIMKGVEMPINILVIVIIAIIVLTAMVVIFSGVWSSGSGTIGLETAKSNACQILITMGCDTDPESVPVNNFDSNGDTKKDSNDNLAELCKRYYSTGDDMDKCRGICGCIV